jgi:Na+-driven multidrug efflux pump
MAAQNIGAGKWDRISKVARAGVGINTLMTATLILGITLGAKPLLSLFLPDGSAAIPVAIHINHIIGWSFILMGISMVLTFLVRANGAVVAPLVILIVSAVIIRFGIGFGLHPVYGADAIWWSFIAASITSFGLTVAYYLNGGWKRAKTTLAPGHPEAA